jgi:hypothetical protein
MIQEYYVQRPPIFRAVQLTGHDAQEIMDTVQPNYGITRTNNGDWDFPANTGFTGLKARDGDWICLDQNGFMSTYTDYRTDPGYQLSDSPNIDYVTGPSTP